ncbi:type II secretion system protein [bacterium]|nr:type II secretion system protein [candidate division CSSED10-310 bacterium]
MSRRSNGFTLLEIMVAITILGISLGVIMEIFSNGLKAAHKNKDLNTAMLLAQSKMEELMMEREVVEGTDSGVFEGMDGYRWEMEVVPWEYPDDLFLSSAQREELEAGNVSEEDKQRIFRVMEIRVKVIWTRGGQDSSYLLTTLRTLPPEEDEIPL